MTMEIFLGPRPDTSSFYIILFENSINVTTKGAVKYSFCLSLEIIFSRFVRHF